MSWIVFQKPNRFVPLGFFTFFAGLAKIYDHKEFMIEKSIIIK